MKEALTELGLECRESADVLTVTGEGLYRSTIIDCNSGIISFDESSGKIIDNIKKAYTMKFYRSEAIKEGMNIETHQEANGDVLIYLTH